MKLSVKILLLIVACLLASVPGSFAASDAVSPSLQEALAGIDRERHYENPFWLSLLYYRRSGILNDSWGSEADSKTFFISSTGKRSPADEMRATVTAFWPGPWQRTDLICKFPARYYQLQRFLRLGFQYDPLEHCPQLMEWMKPLQTDSVSIIFASAYVESPSSMFGHTFLRFFNASDTRGALNSATINFAADTRRNEGMFNFVTRGLFGGFPGVIDVLPLHRRLKDYTEIEGRDLWEYRLRLNSEEVRLLASHAYEVREGVFDYFFIDENCAYRVLSIIAATRADNSLADGFTDSTVPVDTLRRLMDRNLVLPADYWPSQTRALYAAADQLDAADIAVARALALRQRNVGSVQQYSPQRRKAILRVAYQYLSLRISRGEHAAREDKRRIHELLLALMQLRDEDDGLIALAAPSLSPEQGHKTSRAALSLGRQDRADYVQLGVRGAYHDLRDPLPGYNAGAAVSVLDLDLRFSERSDIGLQQFTLLDVQSVNTVNAFFQPTSWSLHIGRQRLPLAGRQMLLNTIDYQRGRSWDIGDNSFTILLGAGLHGAEEFSRHHGVQLQSRLQLSSQHDLANSVAYLRYQQYVSGTGEDSAAIGVELATSVQDLPRVALYAERADAAGWWWTDLGVRCMWYW